MYAFTDTDTLSGHAWNVFYVEHRNYGTFDGETIIMYSFLIVADKICGVSTGIIMYIVS